MPIRCVEFTGSLHSDLARAAQSRVFRMIGRVIDTGRIITAGRDSVGKGADSGGTRDAAERNRNVVTS